MIRFSSPIATMKSHSLLSLWKHHHHQQQQLRHLPVPLRQLLMMKLLSGISVNPFPVILRLTTPSWTRSLKLASLAAAKSMVCALTFFSSLFNQVVPHTLLVLQDSTPMWIPVARFSTSARTSPTLIPSNLLSFAPTEPSLTNNLSFANGKFFFSLGKVTHI